MTTGILEIDTASDDTLRLTLAGEWRLGNVQPSAHGLLDQLKEQKVNRVSFDTNRLDAWDSMLMVFIARISAAYSCFNCNRNKTLIKNYFLDLVCTCCIFSILQIVFLFPVQKNYLSKGPYTPPSRG